MPRNYDNVKIAKLRRSKKRAKLVEWETRVLSRGIKYVPVEVSAAVSRPKQREKASRLPRAENDHTLREAAPQAMDVDETFWVEEPVIPTSEKRVR